MKILKVRYPSGSYELVANLYIPNGTETQKLPAIVVGHPGNGVKEQTAGLYASKLAEHGFIALAFDSAFQGESSGLPRGLEDPTQRMEDLKSSITYLMNREDVDSDKLGLVGICASGGYAIPTAVTDLRIKAVATVSAADIGTQFRKGADGKQDSSVVKKMLELASISRASSEDDKFRIFPKTREDALSLGSHVFDGWDYYCTPRGEHPNCSKDFLWLSVERVCVFDSFSFISLLTQPLLMIVGEKAETKWMTTENFDRAVGLKKIHWVQGASHVDLYDKAVYVDEAVSQISTWFTNNI